MTRDAALVCAAGGLRAAAISLVGVLIVIHLASRGLSVGAIGLVIGTGIAASAAGTIITALRADRWGRRRTLVVLSLLSAAGYAALAFTAALPVLILIAAAAMLNGLGRDRGPASALEQALLPATTTDERRTWTMAWYNAVVDSGHAVGALGAALPTVLAGALDIRAIDGRALTFALCAIVVAASAIPYVFLGPHVEQAEPASGLTNDAVDPRTRAVVRRIAGLFAIDSIGGGFLSSALVAYWFFERYGTTEVQLAYLFFAARILNVVSHLAAAWIARRIGLVNTMVLTHLPSSVFMMLAPAAPTAAVAAALFLAREALVEMDVPTRQSYVLAVVPPSARTYASGMTNVTRNAGWAVGPLIGGSVMQHLSLAAPLFIGGTLKILYDLALYRSFRHLKAPEEAI
ncbi:MAG TPA: MFS transporter [Vicinamibacterales bacterium]|nr:MFS transporter [Vicinamibacterales bacterium]